MSPRGPWLGVIAPLVALNVAIWAIALVLFRDSALLLGACGLAWMLGLRHAVDADHIAAIDGATRRLMAEGSHEADKTSGPMLTGLYFSLGHSTVVWLASLGVALAAGGFSTMLGGVEQIGSVVGPGTSIVFLFAIALANLGVLAGLLHTALKRRKRSGSHFEELNDRLVPGGPLARLVRPLFRLVTRSRHMFAIGVLFGLGFDTATAIMALGISASAAMQGMTIWSILLFPALFTAAMALVDTLDSILMTRAYGFTLEDPDRKLTYNIAITAVAVFLALVIGLAQMLAVMPSNGGMQAVTGVLEHGGYTALALFGMIWLGGLIVSTVTRQGRWHGRANRE